ncbi:MAG: hypothetical protein HUJ75_06235, partial [Parasporobacterium sp.]|nr:hypothetical protein [Parasporobacterium sp.]
MAKKNSNTMPLEKASIKDSIWVLKGIVLPILPLLGIVAATIISAYAGINISTFTGDMVDAGGNIPTDKLISYVVSYLLIGLGAAVNVVATAYATEKIALALRQKLWKKIMYVNQRSYGKDGEENLVSRITTDCNFASVILTVAISMASIIVSICIYLVNMFKLNTTIALAILILVPISVVVGWLYAKFRFIVGQKTQHALAKTTAYLVERSKNLNLIKTSNAQAEETERGLE